MSIVKGETRKYSTFQLALGRLTNELSGFGREVRNCRRYDAIDESYKLEYRIGDSKVLLTAKEEEFVLKASLVILGKDHLSVREQISGALKRIDMENIKVERYKPKNNP